MKGGCGNEAFGKLAVWMVSRAGLYSRLCGVGVDDPLSDRNFDMIDRERLQDLYRERAHYADIESDCADAKKYTRVGGVFWRFFSWIERRAAASRLKVQEEIDFEMGMKP
jgi:hypothetical protein